MDRDAAAWLTHGLAETAAGRHAPAADAFRAALRHDPGLLPAHNNLALALRATGRLHRAEAAARAGLRRGPGAAPLHHTLGLILRDRQRHAESALAHARAADLMPAMAAAHAALGNARRTLGDTAGAEGAMRTALRLQPSATTEYALAMLLLATGRHAEGWALHEARLADHPAPSAPRWDGTPTTRTVLIEAEQGFGDTIQFARLLPGAARRAPVIARVPPALLRLLPQLDVPMVSNAAPPPPHDLHAPLMSLPLLLGHAPPTPPYLAADPGAWPARLAHVPRPWVGLAWAGGTLFAEAADKVLPAAETARLVAALPGAVSLQVGDAPRLPPRARIFDPTAGLADFADTASLIAALDLVISVDTAVAHLAGAMGRPIWLLDRADGCWRWQPGFGPDAWYPGLRIFRQPSVGDWRGVGDAVLAALGH